jgi:hypothetical protein
LNHLLLKRLRLIDQKHTKIINCQSASIHYQDYWLNNNDWGSYNEGFGTQCVWLDNQNSWGYATHTGSNSSGIKVTRLWFGTQGNVTTTNKLPKKHQRFRKCSYMVGLSAKGRSWNAAYDIWF